MGMLVLIFLTAFISMIAGAVMLIQLGGWLPILVAILLIIQWFLSTGFIMIFAIASMYKKEEKEKNNT